MFEKIKEYKKRKEASLIAAKNQERERLMNMSEKEILIELVILMKEISSKCDDIENSIAIHSN